MFLVFLLLALIERLGNDAWPDREAATRALAALDVAAMPALVEAAAHPDPEVRARARRLRDDLACLPGWSGLLPWLDMLPADWPDRQGTMDRHLTALRLGGYQWGAKDWPEYRQATALLLAELRAAGWDKDRIIRLLDDMADEESRYRAHRGMVPQEWPRRPELLPLPREER